jgi:hypothetical protein
VFNATVVPTLHKSAKATLYGAFSRILGFIASTIALLTRISIKNNVFPLYYAPKKVTYEVIRTNIGHKT